MAEARMHETNGTGNGGTGNGGTGGTGKKLSNVQTVAPALLAVAGTLAAQNVWLAGLAVGGAIVLAITNIVCQTILDRGLGRDG